MFKHLAILASALMISLPSFAQEFGLTGGFHQSSASAKNSGVTDDSKIGYKLGLSAKFEMVAPMNFKTGLIYSYRPFELTTSGSTFEFKFSYLDIPALVEYKINEMVGVFGGLVIGLNVSDDVKPSGNPQGMEDIIALGQVGASFLFEDLYGFDIYVERGLGTIYDGAENYMSIGANFVWWL